VQKYRLGKQNKKDTGLEASRRGMHLEQQLNTKMRMARELNSSFFSFSEPYIILLLFTAFAAQGINFSAPVPPSIPSIASNNTGYLPHHPVPFALPFISVHIVSLMSASCNRRDVQEVTCTYHLSQTITIILSDIASVEQESCYQNDMMTLK
jgi:hypothetical protein